MSARGDAGRFLSYIPALIEAGRNGGGVDGFRRVDPFDYDGVVCLVARPGLTNDFYRAMKAKACYLTITEEVVRRLLDPAIGFLVLPPELARSVVEDISDHPLVDVFAWWQGEIPITDEVRQWDREHAQLFEGEPE